MNADMRTRIIANMDIFMRGKLSVENIAN